MYFNLGFLEIANHLFANYIIHNQYNVAPLCTGDYKIVWVDPLFIFRVDSRLAPANERRSYKVTPSLTGLVQT